MNQRLKQDDKHRCRINIPFNSKPYVPRSPRYFEVTGMKEVAIPAEERKGIETGALMFSLEEKDEFREEGRHRTRTSADSRNAMIYKEIAVSKIGLSTILETAKQLSLNGLHKTHDTKSPLPNRRKSRAIRASFQHPPSGEPAESAKHGKTAQRRPNRGNRGESGTAAQHYLKFFRQSVTFFSMPAAEYSRRSNF